MVSFRYYQNLKLFHDLPSFSPPQSLRLRPYNAASEKLAAFHRSPAKIRVVFGGNRAGKTCTGVVECLTQAQRPGTRLLIATETSDMLGRNIWPYLEQYLAPAMIASVRWIDSQKHNFALITLVNGSTITGMSYDQKRRRAQGSTFDVVWFDEEPPHDFYLECLRSIISTGGRVQLTMTPLQGMTWVYDTFKNSVDPTVETWTCSLLDNKYVSQADKDWWISQLSADELAMRVYGEFMRLEGAVWKEFNPEVNIIPSFPIPRAWRKFRAIDYGYANPFCCLWGAQDGDGRLYIYQEHYQHHWLLDQHIAEIQRRDELGHLAGLTPITFYATIADWEAQENAELSSKGIPTTNAIKEIELGIQAVNRRWKVQLDGKPRLMVCANCPITINEIKKYRYESPKPGRNIREQPVKEDDHTQDPLRYLVMYVDHGGELPLVEGSGDRTY